MENILKIRICLLLLFSTTGYSQEIFDYEKHVPVPDGFTAQEINFIQPQENLLLSGTLIYPNAAFEKVVLILPGAGKDSRNSHFRLTEELLKNNIAVFRYDERGVGKSEGDYSSNNYTISNKINDVISAINCIKKHPVAENKKVGLLAHSEGGISSIGAIDKGIQVDFLVQWATPVQKHGTFLKYQIKTGINPQVKSLQYKDDQTKIQVMDLIHTIIEKNKNDPDDVLRKKIRTELVNLGYKKKDFTWYISFPSYLDLLRRDFEATYETLKMPTLYITGGDDKFIESAAEVNLLKSLKNKNIETMLMPDLNHWLTTGNITKMERWLYEIDANALNAIITWINKV